MYKLYNSLKDFTCYLYITRYIMNLVMGMNKNPNYDQYLLNMPKPLMPQTRAIVGEGTISQYILDAIREKNKRETRKGQINDRKIKQGAESL